MKRMNTDNPDLARLEELERKIDEAIPLPAVESWPETRHVFDEQGLWAVRAALTARRPLLVRGEPGTGKSQLARAAAFVLGRAFVTEVVHAHSEYQDLQFTFDAVHRLGEAHTLGVLAAAGHQVDVRSELDPVRFIKPGVLWWAFDWNGAREQSRRVTPIGLTAWTPPLMPGCSERNGCVVLIDEIDKADADLPNGLLETLGNGAFTIPYLAQSIGVSGELPPPLVIVTTNEERELPAAFVRRCLVLNLEVPRGMDELIAWLVHRGEIHFAAACPEDVRLEAARQLAGDRGRAIRNGWPKPGQAEYLDLLRAVIGIARDKKKQLAALEKIRDFALVKHMPERL